jgi:hypothetical protein
MRELLRRVPRGYVVDVDETAFLLYMTVFYRWGEEGSGSSDAKEKLSYRLMVAVTAAL